MALKRKRTSYMRNYMRAKRQISTRHASLVSDDHVPQPEEHNGCPDSEESSLTPSSPSDSEPCAVNSEADEMGSDKEGNDKEPDEESLPLKEQLKTWMLGHNVPQSAGDSLLKVLKQHHPELPSSSRSLLDTPREVQCDNVSGQQFAYLGLEKQILDVLSQCTAEAVENIDRIDLAVNIDGLPLFKSSAISFWPLLCCLMNVLGSIVFPVAFYCGKGKPQIENYLKDFINEANRLGQEGVRYGGRVLKVVVQCVVCDAPARAMVKGITSFAGFFGCDKCVQRGKYVRMKGEHGGRVTFPQLHCEQRTDASFRAQSQPGHHKVLSPFCMLPIDMVDCFPIDAMHQVYEGVMKGLLSVWLRGKKHVQRRMLSATQALEVGLKLTSFRSMIPSVFARKPRPILEFEHWKGTEFRQFLLYTGQLVLKDVLPEALYDHFMMLCVGCSILTNVSLCKMHHRYAHQLLETFVHRAIRLYGPWFLVYNVHSLTHIADSAVKFESLDSCSAWKFENFLGKTKRMVRSGSKPLEQILKRFHEKGNTNPSVAHARSSVQVKRPNNAYVLSDVACCEVIDGQTAANRFECLVYRVRQLYLRPCNAAMLGHFKADGAGVRKFLLADQLQQNAIMIVDSRTRIFLSLLHHE